MKPGVRRPRNAYRGCRASPTGENVRAGAGDRRLTSTVRWTAVAVALVLLAPAAHALVPTGTEEPFRPAATEPVDRDDPRSKLSILQDALAREDAEVPDRLARLEAVGDLLEEPLPDRPGPGPGPSADLDAATASDHDRTPHPPIVITHDLMFKLGPVVGVRNPLAEGTAEDPYVISGWDVDGITLEDTTAHVVVRNNTVEMPEDVDEPAVVVDAAANVAVRDNEIASHDDAVVVREGAASVAVEDNRIASPWLGVVCDAADAAVRDNRLDAFAGVVTFGCSDVEIDGNTVEPSAFLGVGLSSSPGATVTANTVTDGLLGVVLAGSPSSNLTGNTLASNALGIALGESGSSTLAGNVLTSNTIGSLLVQSGDNEIRDNVWTDAGLWILGSSLGHYTQAAVTGNTVNGEPLVYVEGASDVDVTGPAGQVILVEVIGGEVAVNASHTTVGVTVAFSDGVVVRDSVFFADAIAGADVSFSSNVTVRDTEVDRTLLWGYLWFSDDSTVLRNAVTAVVGPIVVGGADHAVRDSSFTGHLLAVLTVASPRFDLSDNAVTDGVLGPWIFDSEDATIAGNTLARHEEIGVIVDDTPGADVTGNLISDNGDHDSDAGIVVHASAGAELHENGIEGNRGAGLVVLDMSSPLNATGNWWGDATGPSGGVQDACTDAVADGGGDAIATEEADVCFDPWLAAP